MREGDLGQLSPDGLTVKVYDAPAGLPGCTHGLLQLEMVGDTKTGHLLACSQSGALTCSIVKAPSVWEVVRLPESASNTNMSRDTQS